MALRSNVSNHYLFRRQTNTFVHISYTYIFTYIIVSSPSLRFEVTLGQGSSALCEPLRSAGADAWSATLGEPCEARGVRTALSWPGQRKMLKES